MPLTAKGEKIMEAMIEQYGEEEGKKIFYASKNAGTITGVDAVGNDDYNNPRLHFFDPTAEQIAFWGDELATDLYARDAPLNAARRKRLPDSDFALPGRRYPIDTPARARSALAYVMQHGTEHEQKTVYAAVRKRYPDMEVAPRGSS
jgi:hypothetical protein